MNRFDDYGRRRRAEHQYGGYEEGYGNVPGGEREWRRRDLSGGRYGNTSERAPYEAEGPTWRDDRRDDGRHATVYYPGRRGSDYRQQESPHAPGYVSAYSSGYEDGYQAGSRSSREMPGSGGTSSLGGYGGRRDAAGGDRYAERHGDRYEDLYGDRYGARRSPAYHVPMGTQTGTQTGTQRESRTGTSQRRVGPKNYVRSDERLREEVCERLAHCDHLDVSEVTVTVLSGVVTLEGTVENRRMKYEIEDVADDTFGVSDVINRLHVRPYGVLASE